MTIYEQTSEEKIKKGHDFNSLQPCETLEGWAEVKGYDFSKDFEFIVKEFKPFQAHLDAAMKKIKKE